MAAESRVPGLPSLPTLEGKCSWTVGPHSTCNFFLPGILLAGSYPGSMTEPEHTAKIKAVLEAGVDTFVCLQEREELSRFTPYISIAKELGVAMRSGNEIEFLHCPIPDGHIAESSLVGAAIATIVDRLLSNHVVYVHCWGGHGRTGTVLCALLVKVYGLNVERARRYFTKTHEEGRVTGGSNQWPHSYHQYEQVRQFEGEGICSMAKRTR